MKQRIYLPLWAGLLMMFTMFGIAPAAWVTHVVVCIKSASWLFLLAGALVFPVGVIHGVGYWFGAW